MSWERKYQELREGLRSLLVTLQLATAGVEPHKDPLGLGLHIAVKRLGELVTNGEEPPHTPSEKAEQLELPLVPRSVSEVQGL